MNNQKETKKFNRKVSGYQFRNLVLAKSFVDHCNKPHFIFELPEGGYLVVNTYGANELWADEHKNVK